MPQTEAGMRLGVVRTQKLTNLLPEKMAGWVGRSNKEPSLVCYLTRCYRFQLMPVYGPDILFLGVF